MLVIPSRSALSVALVVAGWTRKVLFVVSVAAFLLVRHLSAENHKMTQTPITFEQVHPPPYPPEDFPSPDPPSPNPPSPKSPRPPGPKSLLRNHYHSNQYNTAKEGQVMFEWTMSEDEMLKIEERILDRRSRELEKEILVQSMQSKHLMELEKAKYLMELEKDRKQEKEQILHLGRFSSGFSMLSTIIGASAGIIRASSFLFLGGRPY